MQSGENLTLLDAVARYVDSAKSGGDKETIHRELFRFAGWCGRDRALSELQPTEVSQYVEQVEGSRSTSRAAGHLQVVKAFLSHARKKGLLDRNLAQHVRVRRARGRSRTVQGRPPPDAVALTSAGHAQLVARLEKLRGERAPLALEIRRAAADKDVRENVPLEAAREQLGHVESSIRTIESTLRAAVVIDSSGREKASVVKLGVRVSIKELNTGRETTCTLVSRTEANPLEGKISDASPLGKVLMGCAVGQEVDAVTPRGKSRYRILDVTL